MGYFFSLSKSAATAGFEVSEWMLLVFGGVLVLGIFGEYKKLPKRWLLLWPATVFEILVMVGVAGELLGDGGVFVFSSHLQSIEDHELSTLGSNAGQLEARLKIVGDKATQAESVAGTASAASSDAETRSGRATANASTAVKSASSALTIARSARQEADTFEGDIKTARKEAADALANLAEAKRLAEEAQQATARNTEKLVDRTLSSLQQASIAARLRPFGARRIDVIIIGDSGEIGNITGLIDSAIQQAGWTVHMVGKAISGPNVSGVFVGTHLGSDQGMESAANALISALQSEGIATRRFFPQFDDELPMAIMGSWDKNNVAPIRMFVSAKP